MTLADQMANAISGSPLRVLDDLSRDIWKALSAGLLNDDEAQRLAEAIYARRTMVRAQKPIGKPQNAGASASRTWSYFPPKRPQRSPNRQRSIERRRTLAASGPLPPQLAAHFTTGELAVMRIVSDEVGSRGFCALSIPEIAARAGVSISTAKRAFREATKLCLVTVEERRVPYRPNLPNVVRIISREWLIWIDRRGKRSPPSRRGVQKWTATDRGFSERGDYTQKKVLRTSTVGPFRSQGGR